MKKTDLILPLILTTISNCYAGDTGPLYRDYLVKNQPLPNSLIWEQDIVSEEVNFVPNNNSSNKTKIKHNQGEFELFPILTSDRKKSLTAPGFGFVTDNFNNVKSNNSELAKDYSGAYISFFGIAEIASDWYSSGYITHGNYSDNSVKFNSATEKTLAFLNFGYKPTEHQIYKFGLIYSSNFGDGVLLPSLGMSYSWDSWVFDALLPSYVDLRYIHSQKLHTVIGIDIKYSSYYDTIKKDVLQLSGVDFDIRSEYHIDKMFWVHAGISYAGEKQLEWQNEDTQIGTIDAGFKFNAGIIARFLN